jgi:hypothetical protein
MKNVVFISLAILGLSVLAARSQAVAQVTSENSSQPSSATHPAARPATVAQGVDPNAKPSPAPAEQPLSSSHAFTDLTFSKDYNAGTKDASGQFMTGTETMRLLGHERKLFAGLDAWMDIPYNEPRAEGKTPWTGPQVLVKESAAGPWRADISFPYAIRLEGMVSATFITDGLGRKLDPPVKLLVASPSYRNAAACWTRDDGTGKWTRLVIAQRLRGGGVRSFCTHVDKVTGIQYLFGGTTFHDGLSGSIFRAVYDSAAPGKLRWDETPELSGTGRIMCFAEADGVLYAAGGIKDETPLSGGLFRRVDGNTPRWELLWRWPHLIKEQGDETVILRGLIAIPDPNGGKHQVLLGTCDYPGVVYRIDPCGGCAATTELDIRACFAKSFGVAKLAGPCLSAYNNFLPATDPDTGEKVLLLGVWINHPDGHASDKGAGSWYLVRHADGRYGCGRVFDPKDPRPNPPRGLLATRTIEISPFPQDKGRVFYFGGYDCASIESHNTAWIYKAQFPPPKAKE